jgi:hypothetical protein
MNLSESEPGPWVQASSVTKNSPSRLKTASTRPRFVDLERVAGRNLGGAAQINADSSGHARAPRRRPAADFTLPCRRRPNSRSRRPPTGDRRASLLVITVDLYLIPHAVYAIRIGTGKGVHGGAVLGVNHEYAAHGSLAVITAKNPNQPLSVVNDAARIVTPRKIGRDAISVWSQR